MVAKLETEESEERITIGFGGGYGGRIQERTRAVDR